MLLPRRIEERVGPHNHDQGSSLHAAGLPLAGESQLDWFALKTRARHEKLAADVLCSKGYEVFLPAFWRRSEWCDRIKEIESPLFPTYLFCRLDPADQVPILCTAGVVSIVGFGSRPTPVAEAEIVAVREIVQSGLRAEPWPAVQLGERVRIGCGPLCGLEGTLIAFRGRHRLVVSITILQRSVAVEIDKTWVEHGTRETRSLIPLAPHVHAGPAIRP